MRQAMSVNRIRGPRAPLRAGLLAAGLLAAGLARAAAPDAPGAEPVLERCLVSLVEEAKVPAREAGTLVELLAREGDVVAKGDVIARIDDRIPRQKLAQAEAQLAAARAALKVATQGVASAEAVVRADQAT